MNYPATDSNEYIFESFHTKMKATFINTLFINALFINILVINISVINKGD